MSEEDRLHIIERDNRQLMKRMTEIMEPKRTPALSACEFVPGVRLDAHQRPVVDHVNVHTRSRAMSEIQQRMRQREQAKIGQANQDLLKRIQARAPVISHRAFVQERERTESYLRNMSRFRTPRPGELSPSKPRVLSPIRWDPSTLTSDTFSGYHSMPCTFRDYPATEASFMSSMSTLSPRSNVQSVWEPLPPPRRMGDTISPRTGGRIKNMGSPPDRFMGSSRKAFVGAGIIRYELNSQAHSEIDNALFGDSPDMEAGPAPPPKQDAFDTDSDSFEEDEELIPPVSAASDAEQTEAESRPEAEQQPAPAMSQDEAATRIQSQVRRVQCTKRVNELRADREAQRNLEAAAAAANYHATEIPDIEDHKGTVVGFDDPERLTHTREQTIESFRVFTPTTSPFGEDASKGWHVHLNFDILEQSVDSDEFVSVASRIMQEAGGPLQVLRSTANRRLVLTIQSQHKEYFPTECMGLFLGRPEAVDEYPADFDLRRRTYLQMMAGLVRQLDVESVVKGTNDNQLVLTARWHYVPGEELAPSSEDGLVLVALQFLLKFDGYESVFPVKSLLATKVLPPSGEQDDAWTQRFEGGRSVMPQGSYQLSTAEQRPRVPSTLTVRLVGAIGLATTSNNPKFHAIAFLSHDAAATAPATKKQAQIKTSVCAGSTSPQWSDDAAAAAAAAAGKQQQQQQLAVADVHREVLVILVHEGRTVVGRVGLPLRALVDGGGGGGGGVTEHALVSPTTGAAAGAVRVELSLAVAG